MMFRFQSLPCVFVLTNSSCLQREPLSRSLKGRPFDHEDYYEILFPDVIGSRGVPKRLTKPRRKGPDNVNGSEEQEAPGTTVMDILADNTSFSTSTHGHMPQSLQPTPTPAPAPLPTAQAAIHQHHQPHAQQHAQQHQHTQQQHVQQAQHVQLQQQARVNSAILPPRSAVPSTLALTPPDDQATQHTRKRFQHADTNGTGHPPSQPEKRRRTTAASAAAAANATPASTYPDTTQQQAQAQTVQPQAAAMGGLTGTSTATAAPPSQGQPNGAAAGGDNIVHLLTEALRQSVGKPRMTWQEQAMDMFFRDFHDEDLDLQLKIAEKVLTDENKAMFFVKMPLALRRHWVKRLRELHNNRNS